MYFGSNHTWLGHTFWHALPCVSIFLPRYLSGLFVAVICDHCRIKPGQRLDVTTRSVFVVPDRPRDLTDRPWVSPSLVARNIVRGTTWHHALWQFSWDAALERKFVAKTTDDFPSTSSSPASTPVYNVCRPFTYGYYQSLLVSIQLQHLENGQFTTDTVESIHVAVWQYANYRVFRVVNYSI